MMRSCANILLVSLLALGAFGFAVMGHGDGHGVYRCVAETVQGAGCPPEAGLASLSFHMGAWRHFSTAALVSGFVLLLLLLAVAFGLRESGNPLLRLRRILPSLVPVSYVPEERFLNWLELHESRGSF